MWLVTNHPSGTPCTSALCGKKVSELMTRRYAARGGERSLLLAFALRLGIKTGVVRRAASC